MKHRLVAAGCAFAMMIGAYTPVLAEVNVDEESIVESVVVNAKVGDGGAVVTSFDISVKDADVAKDLKAEDFDITGNTSTRYFDVETGEFVTDYEDDGIVVTVDGTSIHMDVEPFSYNGEWLVTCTTPTLSFNKEKVVKVNTLTLDDAERGEFTYAGITRKYALYVPKDENGEEKTNLPLVIWNHGGGEYGPNVDIETTLRANRGLTAWNENGYECAVLMFQISNDNYSYGAANDEAKKMLIDQNNALQMAFARELIAKNTVDASRVYVTGASSGGGATMRFVMQFADEVAGAIACCSMDPIVHIHNNNNFNHDTAVKALEEAWKGNVYTWDGYKGKMVEKKIDTEALVNTPITFTHAQNDPTCNVESSKCYYEALNNLGAKNNKLIIWSDEDMKEYKISNSTAFGAPYLLHWSWVRMLNDTTPGQPMDWLFQQRISDVMSVVVNAKVGDGALVVTSFDITVSDAEAIMNLKAEDFAITGNTSTRVLDSETGGFVTDYADDGIKVKIDGATIHMEVEPFKYDADWKVSCAKAAVNFAKEDVAEVKTLTLDEAERGEFTYAGLTRQYALYLPKNDDGSIKKNVPIVIWNHGGGEYAGDIEATLQANRGLTAWNENGYECAVLMFQISNDNYSYGAANDEAKKMLIDQNNALQMAFVRQLIAKGTVDANRVYVTGASSGGGATMRFVMQFADEVAGAIACCSMDPIVHIHNNNNFNHDTAVKALEEAWKGNVYTWDETKGEMVEKAIDTEAFVNTPITFTHAENDPVCNVESSKCYYEALNNLGAKNNCLVIWSDGDMKEYKLSNSKALGAAYLLHWSWVRVLNDTSEGSPMDWLFKQTNNMVTSVVVNSKVGDGGVVVTSFDITVGDASAIAGLNANDFAITGNTSTRVLDAEKGGFVTEYEDDGIVVSIAGATIHMEVEPFSFNGDWHVVCTNPAVSFDKDNVTEVHTLTLDEAERGEYTYAGLTRKYALYLPKDGEGNVKTNVPIVIWNHGGGEYGPNVDIETTLRANRGLTAWNENGYECAVLMFQISNDNYSYFSAYDEAKKMLIDQNNALQMAFVRELINKDIVDPGRVYVTGASSGGGATMRFVMQFADEVAGAIACCSMDPIVHIHLNDNFDHDATVKALEEAWKGNVYTWDGNLGKMVATPIDTEALVETPITFTHAQNDPTCNVESSKCYFEALNNLGAKNNKLIIWSDDDMKEYHISNDESFGAPYLLHWSWVRMLNDATEGQPMDWLFKQELSSARFFGFKKVGDDLFWYEDGKKQGVYGDPKNIFDVAFGEIERGREIYDPKSDAWYWLDAVKDGAVAKKKEVWMPYVFQGDNDPNGKWVRYDKYGQMIKGWYANDNGVYYYDLITGAMYKGAHVVNGKTYLFDEITGIRQ